MALSKYHVPSNLFALTSSLFTKRCGKLIKKRRRGVEEEGEKRRQYVYVV
jgi:hypothetical protein